MARRHQHEDHVNHEAWAIPYGDLVTLLLAFFVVMYAVSSVNEGKYRVMADAMSSAFGGTPRSISPIQLGQTQKTGSAFDRPSLQTPGGKAGPASAALVNRVRMRQVLDMPTFGRQPQADNLAAGASGRGSGKGAGAGEQQLSSLGEKIQQALTELVRQNLVTVRRGRSFIEVEIQSDILFASGAAAPSTLATTTVRKLAGVLRDAPNAVRVEGYTDNQPINTAAFPSNWELSAARAASVVHVLADEGIVPTRLALVGFGEHQPIADNTTDVGRNANRRVMLVILAAPQGPDAVPDASPAIALQRTSAPAQAIDAAAQQRAAPVRATPAGIASATALAASPSRRVLSRNVASPHRLRTRNTRGIATHPAAPASSTSVAAQVAPQPGAG